MSGFIEQLEAELAKSKAIPFLFVGSGLSRRYINLEDWAGLLSRFADGLTHPFSYHRSKVNGDLPKAAECLADEFFEHWWKSPDHASSRSVYGAGIVERADCLKLAIADYLKVNPLKIPSEFQQEVDLLRQASVDGLITTNWDLFLESVFPDYDVFIGQEELLLRRPQEIGEIYKIHGCSSRPKSLILTATDYQDFEAKNPYLAAKLVALFVERPIIFLGYSLTDEHIRALLRSIALGIGVDNLGRIQDKLIFVQRDSNNLGDGIEKSSMTIGNSVLPITIFRTNDFGNVYLATQGLKRDFSVKVLSTLKKYVYEIVKTTEPHSKIAVVDFDKVEKEADIDVVVGVGVLRKLGIEGYTPITRKSLLLDVLGADDKYEAKNIVDTVLPRILVGNTKYVPVFKYFKAAGLPVPLDSTNPSRLVEASRCDQNSFVHPYYRKHQKRVQDAHTVLTLQEEHGDDCIFYMPLLKVDKVELEDLRQFCLENFEKYWEGNINHKTYFSALVCYYDYAKFARAQSQT